MSDYQLRPGDCLEILPTLPEGSVDAIITDLPYGTTACKWDSVIPLEPMWKQVKRICRGAFVTTASQPFASALIMSNPKMFKYEWVWDKVNKYTRYYLVKKMPLLRHDSVVVFYEGLSTYNPQFRTGKPYVSSDRKSSNTEIYNDKHVKRTRTINSGSHYPCSVLTINGDEKRFGQKKHPTQKPVALYEYLVKTYTNEGDTVLDFCMGSGTTGVACFKTGRKFVGIEKEPKYFEIAKRRIEELKEKA